MGSMTFLQIPVTEFVVTRSSNEAEVMMNSKTMIVAITGETGQEGAVFSCSSQLLAR